MGLQYFSTHPIKLSIAIGLTVLIILILVSLRLKENFVSNRNKTKGTTKTNKPNNKKTTYVVGPFSFRL